MYVYTYAHKSYYHLQDAKILKINGTQLSYLIISFPTFKYTRDATFIYQRKRDNRQVW